MADEIERKFLVKSTDILTGLTGDFIKQGYLERRTVAFVKSNGPATRGTASLMLSAFREEITAVISVPDEDREGLEKLLAGPDVTVRIRIKSQKGLITLKGPTVGISRPEFEYEIALGQALAALEGPYVLPGVIEKTRFGIEYAGRLFEVDVFEGKLAGLVIAEVELGEEDAHVEIPDWVGEEVSDDPRYFNSNLAKTGVVPAR
jgi:adenylate cyclase